MPHSAQSRWVLVFHHCAQNTWGEQLKGGKICLDLGLNAIQSMMNGLKAETSWRKESYSAHDSQKAVDKDKVNPSGACPLWRASSNGSIFIYQVDWSNDEVRDLMIQPLPKNPPLHLAALGTTTSIHDTKHNTGWLYKVIVLHGISPGPSVWVKWYPAYKGIVCEPQNHCFL